MKVKSILTFRGHQRLKRNYFLSNFYWLLLSISYGFQESTWKISRYDLDRWPLTFVTRGQKYFRHSKAHTTSYLTFIDILSISYRFRNIPLQSFQGLTLTFDLAVTWGQRISAIWKPICDFLQFLLTFSLSYRFRDIQLRSFQGLTLTTFRTWGQKYFRHLKNMTSYLTCWHFLLLPFSRYSILQFLGFDLDLWKVTRSKILAIWKLIYDFLSNFYWHFLSISYRFRDIRFWSF